MLHLIPLTHTETGEEKQFADFASIASFLKSEAESAVKWTGWEFARLHADLAEVVAMIEGKPAAAPVAQAAEPASVPAVPAKASAALAKKSAKRK